LDRAEVTGPLALVAAGDGGDLGVGNALIRLEVGAAHETESCDADFQTNLLWGTGGLVRPNGKTLSVGEAENVKAGPRSLKFLTAC
jgi:hypothetical protein